MRQPGEQPGWSLRPGGRWPRWPRRAGPAVAAAHRGVLHAVLPRDAVARLSVPDLPAPAPRRPAGQARAAGAVAASAARRCPPGPPRAAWRVTPVCQRCGTAAAGGRGRCPRHPDRRCSVTPRPGKTRFLYASLNSLISHAAAAELAVQLPGPGVAGAGRFRPRRDPVRAGDGQDLDRTARSRSPSGWARAAGPNWCTCSTPPGSTSATPRRPDALGSSTTARGWSTSWTRSRSTPSAGNSAAGTAPAMRPRPRRGRRPGADLRRGRVPAAGQRGARQRERLAVVVSKTDLLRAAGLELPGRAQTRIAQWLWDSGMHNLVIVRPPRLRRGQVLHGRVAAGAAGRPGRPGGAAALAADRAWLRLPADPADPATPARGSGRTGRTGRTRRSRAQAGGPGRTMTSTRRRTHDEPRRTSSPTARSPPPSPC